MVNVNIDDFTINVDVDLMDTADDFADVPDEIIESLARCILTEMSAIRDAEPTQQRLANCTHSQEDTEE